jgi:hypothetical protein
MAMCSINQRTRRAGWKAAEFQAFADAEAEAAHFTGFSCGQF